MKTFLLFFTLLLCYFIQAQTPLEPNYPAAPPAPQNIVQAEYFFDTDPGFGNGIVIPLSPGVDLAGIAFTANTASLSNGIHRLFVRARSNEGRWSLVSVREFLVDFNPAYPAVPVTQNVTQAEYFIDADPGFGNGAAIPFTPAVDVSNLVASINTTGLSSGAHRFFIRSRNNGSRWSIIASREFLVDTDPAYPTVPAPQNVTQAEYFINTDPGFGNGIAIPVTAALDINNLVAAINTSALAPGTTNRLFVRSRSNEGRWSIVGSRTFIVDIVAAPLYPAAPPPPQNIVQAEYFINTDPGFGNGVPIPLTPGIDLNNVTVNVNTAALLPASTNNLFIRSLNNEGRWSLVAVRIFSVDIITDPVYPVPPPPPGNVVYAEYFFNTDPGFGNATPITLTPGTDISSLTFSANTSALGSGAHQLFVRSLDDWSLTAWAAFTKANPLPLRFLSFSLSNAADWVQLDWKTVDEINTSHILIERSATGQGWTAIGRLNTYNTPGNHAYSYRDAQPLGGVSYYRLKQVDLDSAHTYSPVLSVNRKEKSFTAYPNPVTNQLTVLVPPLNRKRQLVIADMAGRTIIQQLVSEGQRFVILNTQTFAPGSYQLYLQDGSITEKQTIIKQ